MWGGLTPGGGTGCGGGPPGGNPGNKGESVEQIDRVSLKVIWV